MPRRTRLPATPSTSKSGPVTVRSMSSPRDGWTLEQALALVEKGYTPAHVQRLTGGTRSSWRPTFGVAIARRRMTA